MCAYLDKRLCVCLNARNLANKNINIVMWHILDINLIDTIDVVTHLKCCKGVNLLAHDDTVGAVEHP